MKPEGLVGSRVGHYEIRALIGTGGFATVYEAFDPRLRSAVAVKVLADNHALNPDVRERFVAEGHLLRRINNPSTIQVFDIGETEMGNPFLVLALADRGDFRQRIAELRADGWSPTVEDLRLVAAVLREALGGLHADHVVHRDVKPENLLLRSSRRVVVDRTSLLVAADEQLLLADLGLAKDLAMSSGITVGAGSSGFAAPEQLLAGLPVDQRADVYAASALLAWLISGTLPTDEWQAATDSDWADVVSVVAAGLSPDPALRQPDIDVWFEQVERGLGVVETAVARNLQQGMPSSGDDGTSPRDTAEGAGPARSAKHSAKRVIGLALAIVVVLGGFAGWAWSTTRQAEPVSTVLELPDGGGRAEERLDDTVVLAIEGPRQIVSGTTARYIVDQTGIERWVWTAPDGRRYDDVPAIDVAATSTGPATVEVSGFTIEDVEVHVRYQVEVVDGE